jgi:hypothetical protein
VLALLGPVGVAVASQEQTWKTDRHGLI